MIHETLCFYGAVIKLPPHLHYIIYEPPINKDNEVDIEWMVIPHNLTDNLSNIDEDDESKNNDEYPIHNAKIIDNNISSHILSKINKPDNNCFSDEDGFEYIIFGIHVSTINIQEISSNKHNPLSYNLSQKEKNFIDQIIDEPYFIWLPDDCSCCS